MRLRAFLKTMVIVGLLACAAASAHAAGGIAWRDYDAAAFAEARDTNRVLVVNVGHEGCTACRMMEENTFSDARVIALMNDAFVPIQVDSEMQPDIGERYSDWAWPATAFLKPDGNQVFAIRGSRRADDFLNLLKRVLERQQAGELKSDALTPYTAPTEANDDPLVAIRAKVRGQLDNSFDDERGGWGSAKILEYAEPTLQLFARGYLYQDAQATARALKTARGFLRQTDPVWGGMFYASFERWDNVVTEKRLESQAAALQLFADALQVSGEAAFGDGLDNVHRYLRDFMRASDGTFYANQKDTGPALAAGQTMDDYYALDDAGRRALGLPVIDRAVYTDVNARVIVGLVRAFEASGNAAFLDTALAAAETLVAQRQTADGWMLQFAADPSLDADVRVHQVQETGRPYLRAQAHFGLAALALYQATHDVRWRAVANDVVRGLNKTLADHELGGFFSSPARGVDAVVGRRKGLEDNAAAARLVYWVGILEKDVALRAQGEQTVRAVASDRIVRHEGRITGSLAMTLELLTAGYVEYSVVGEGDLAAALLDAGRRVYEPRRLLHPEAPGRYPERPLAAMYICNDDQCSVPISDPALVAAKASQFTPAALRAVAVTVR